MPHDHGASLQFGTISTLSLGTLGASTALLKAFKVDATRLNGWYEIWCKLAGNFAGKTSTEGPLLLGICANMNAAELKAILEDDPQNSQTPTKTGPGSWYYPIIWIGLDATEGDINGEGQSSEIQATSKFTKYPVKWAIPEGQDFSLFVYNADSGALTTGTVITFAVQHFGAWLRD